MADKRIRGLTIQIGADTLGLDKALKNVESKSRTAAGELRVINKSIKVAGDSAELWQQKQSLLNTALDSSKKKVKILEDAQRGFAERFQRGEIDQGTYDKFQEKLKKAREKLVELMRQQEKIESEFRNGEIDQGAYDKFCVKVEAAEKEVRKLESANLSMEENLRVGNISEEQYRAFRRELMEARGEVTRHENSLREAISKVKELGTESDGAADDIEELADSAADAGESAEKSGDGFTVLKGTVAELAADAIKKAVDGFKELAAEGETALNLIQARTGATAGEIEQYRNVMNKLYANNFGENKTDLADSISVVRQQLGELSPEKLEKITQNAILMRDTFGYDVAESVRTVKMLMEQFGISAEEAYNLIAQGTQNGLDKNGDLLDTLNEYSVHYSTMGYSAEGFFNSLANGTAAGMFSVDKLGDAVKEFGIRSKDTSDTTTEGFTLLGLNADEMRDKFAQGGTAAQEATRQTIEALFSLEDQVKMNQAGVDLFGTMWEDLGKDGVSALMDVSGEADKASSALEDINKVRYNDAGNRLEQLRRKAVTELLEPAANKLLPKIEDGTDWLIDNLPDILDTGKKLVPVVAGIGTAFGAWKIGKSVTALLSGNPLGVLATALGAVTTAAGLFKDGMKDGMTDGLSTPNRTEII